MPKHHNIILTDVTEPIQYKSSRSVVPKGPIPSRERHSHGTWLMEQFSAARTKAKSYTPSMVAAIKSKQGMYMEFTGAAGFELAYKGLENIRSGIRLLNVRPDDNAATVFIPDGKESLFIKKISDYLEKDTEKGEPRNKDLVASIEQIKAATIEAFWIGDKEDIPHETPTWCEIWLRTEQDNAVSIREDFYILCNEIGVEYKHEHIEFPERSVVLVRVNHQHLSIMLETTDYMAELRRAPERAAQFINMPPREESAWADDLRQRLVIQKTTSAVCILDTGVAYAHPLLEQTLPDTDAQAVVPAWGNNDHEGHGTAMAGVALYNDLMEAVLSQDPVVLTHSLESVKILPPIGRNSEELYGAITRQGALLAEINHPEKKRAFCMAVTADDKAKDGRPSSWSGEVDNLAAGVNDSIHRLFIISAGNVGPTDLIEIGYPETNRIFSVENPGQAWNALTVGAYANLIETYIPNYHALADVGELSPHSSTSTIWSTKWPVKPDILCAGGNMATDGTFYTDSDELSLLTLNHNFLHHKFDTTRATSAAAAQAAWMAAKILTVYPELWPETIRGLLVHSAKWTKKMIDMFCIPDTKTGGRRQLLRMCGYGIPDLDAAINCVDNSVNMIIQGEIQPFKRENSRCTMNEMNLHTIPWPKEVLRDLGEIPVTMRVTLSYFIEPGPGEVGWKDKYRYPSCGLRFDVNKIGETKEEFVRRINIAMREEDEDHPNSGGSERWFLGKNRDVGSIHSDFWEGSAADLCDSNFISVYPTIGWWRQRTNLGMYNRSIRYALLISISSPSVETDLYTPIMTQIKVPVEIDINTDKKRQ